MRLNILIVAFVILYLLVRYINKHIMKYENNEDIYTFIDFTGVPPVKNNKNPIDEMKKYNVIFAGTIKNVEAYIQKTLDNINKCGEKFNSYLLIIYENDSTDKTREILLQNKKNIYEYIFEDNVTEPRRTMRLANGRNKILDRVREIQKNNNDYYNYLIMLDMDDVNQSGKFVDTIDTCFEYDNWDILTGNQSDKYYDLWALRKKGDMECDCWKMHFGHGFDPYYKSFIYLPNHLLEVDSAFGGIGIYKLSSIPDECNYVGRYNNDEYEHCEHVEFHRCIKKSGKGIYINTKFLTN